MQRNFLSVFFISGLMLLGGCAQTTGRTGPKEVVNPSFQPKKVYAIDMNRAWDLTLRALNREGVSLEMANKETGLIRTGYQNLSPWERNKCDLRFSQEPQRKIFINVRCQYESRKEATEPFKVFTYGVPQEAMKAEEDIYRKIEAYILPLERTPMAQEDLAAKGQLQPLPPPVVTAPPTRPEATSPPTPQPPSPKPETAAPLAPPAVVAQETQGITGEKLSTRVTTIEAANVRQAPSVQSKIITVLKKGERVEKVGESGTWTKIKLTSGEVAWVHSDFVQEVMPATTRETGKKGVEGTSKIFLVTKAIVKMMAEPSSTSKVVLVLKKGREVEKIGESGNYTKIRLSWGDTGWVPTRFLERVR